MVSQEDARALAEAQRVDARSRDLADLPVRTTLTCHHPTRTVLMSHGAALCGRGTRASSSLSVRGCRLVPRHERGPIENERERPVLARDGERGHEKALTIR